jgi:hypothetical protein
MPPNIWDCRAFRTVNVMMRGGFTRYYATADWIDLPFGVGNKIFDPHDTRRTTDNH